MWLTGSCQTWIATVHCRWMSSALQCTLLFCVVMTLNFPTPCLLYYSLTLHSSHQVSVISALETGAGLFGHKTLRHHKVGAEVSGHFETDKMVIIWFWLWLVITVHYKPPFNVYFVYWIYYLCWINLASTGFFQVVFCAFQFDTLSLITLIMPMVIVLRLSYM